MGKRVTENQGELLDLKTYCVGLKNKLFTADQQREHEVSMKNKEISKLETQLKQELSKRTTREQKIQELE